MKYHITGSGTVYPTIPSEGVPEGCSPVAVVNLSSRTGIDRLLDALDHASDQRGWRPIREARSTRIDALTEALRDYADPPPEVYEHFVMATGVDNLKGGPLPTGQRSLCGKVWQTHDRARSIGRCPVCLNIVDGGWTK